ncbi:MAG TPA: pitrilysin family protein [Niabella sp.]|nr:pitrilysin family protein [Niabella sp.]HQW14890.1 pitrilysin family protein [Niabella sp.]HQX18485.1 pitrilysin family protein [Niabella sp.]HQX41483.1 pitrilysin family protein [Niabella sp.]HRB06012.1 pitrilysin family protein [Niabella sp.]
MKKIFIAFTAIVCTTSVFAQIKIDRTKQPKSGPAPVIKIADPANFVLPNGMTVLVVENHKLPKITASLSSNRGSIIEGEKAGVISLMGTMLNEGTKTLTKEQFDEKVEMMGASVSLDAGGGSVAALTRYFAPSLMLMAEALRNPAFKEESLDKLKSQTITALKSQEKNAKAISGRIVNAIAFGKNSAQGEFETIKSIEGLRMADVKEAYQKYLSPANMILTFVGDITPAKAKELTLKAFGSWKGAKIPIAKDAPVPNPKQTEIDLVDVPSAVQSEVTVASLITNPMSNPDHHALVLANHILGGGSEGKLFMNLREKHGFTYGAYSTVGAGRYQAKVSSSASVRNDKVDSAVAEIVKEINNMRAGNISADELAIAKAVYNGGFALRMESPQTAATYASNILINNLPKDFYRTYLQKINAVTVADIKRVAQKYFSTSNTRIFVVGKSSVVKPGLEKLGYPVKLYDAFANPVTETKTTAIDNNLTAQTVIDKYLAAIGGKAALEKVKAFSADMVMSVSGQNLDGIMKKAAPNKFLMQLTMQGMTVMKMAFNGKAGYQEQMGQKKEMGADDIANYSDARGVFDQIFYTDAGYKMSQPSIEKVNGEDAYKVVVTKPSGKVSSEFYSIKTGLLLREEIKVKAAGQEVETSFEYGNYVTVGGVKFPGEMTQSVAGQPFSLTLTNYKINEGVSDKDFE